MGVMSTLAAQSCRNVRKANFRSHRGYAKAKLGGLSANLVEVYCQCPPELARERYDNVQTESTHHPARVTPTLDPAFLAEFDRPIGIETCRACGNNAAGRDRDTGTEGLTSSLPNQSLDVPDDR
jgi:hypothetical protein